MTRSWKRIQPFLFWVVLFAPILGVSILGYLEYTGFINYVEPGPPYEMQTTAQLIGASVSTFLTYGLVILYRQQTKVQSNQEGLMKNEHKPKVELINARIYEGDGGFLVFKLSNSGKGTATNIQARVDIDVDTEIDIALKPKWQKLTRDIDRSSRNGNTDEQQVFYSSGEYLSPEEGEVDFRYSDRIDARQSDGGSKTIDNTSFSNIHYYFARVTNDDLGLYPPRGPDARDIVHNSIDFDRLRVKYTICFEDIDEKEYQRTIIDYLVPVIHGVSKLTCFEVGMPYEEYMERKQQEFFQRTGQDPLELQVKNHFNIDRATEVLPSAGHKQ